MVSKAPNGFTLIELLVAIAIVLVMTGGVIVNYNTYNDDQRTRQAALTVKNNLRLAQSRAYNGEKPTSSCTQLQGYRVSFASGSYAIQAQCTEGLAGSPQSYTLDRGITFSPVPTDILFRVLTSGADGDVTVIVIGLNKSVQFTVAKSGDMSELTVGQ